MKDRSWILTVALLGSISSQEQAWQVFDMNTAGFPSNTVSDIAIDSQDNVWVGTDWGLCKYDGSIWTIFQTGNSGIPDNVINTVAVDSLDRVWVGTLLHGVAVYDGLTWENFTTQNSDLPDDEIKSITIDFRGWAWIGTYVGLACYTGLEWRIYTDQSTSYNGLLLNGPVIEDVAVRPDGLVAIGTLNYGFHYMTDTNVFVYASYFNSFPDNTQLGVVFDELHNERWLACPSGGLLRQGGDPIGGPWFQYTTQNSTLATNTLSCIAIDGPGRLWIGSALAGLIVRNVNETFSEYSTFNSDIPDNTVQSVVVAHDGSIWVGTYYGGAARLDLSTKVGTSARERMVHVFPNPATDHVNVQWMEEGGPLQWILTDMEGRHVMHGEASTGGRATISVSTVEAGSYLLGILVNASYRTVKILISR